MPMNPIAEAAELALAGSGADGGLLILLGTLAGVGFLLWRRGGRR